MIMAQREKKIFLIAQRPNNSLLSRMKFPTRLGSRGRGSCGILWLISALKPLSNITAMYGTEAFKERPLLYREM